ncbi:hypothetical protein B0H65DRAFT_134240 [Neurospora tetraspora]|uniref:Uncharacterized protein n=1 Tax=Neurospora tetraspora TaxID=94610 RepID=A0AAE0JLW6_9PEZI|nr:hypothetical protein B0H65DRAFT_134240 [Neurospora tetraspora]
MLSNMIMQGPWRFRFCFPLPVTSFLLSFRVQGWSLLKLRSKQALSHPSSSLYGNFADCMSQAALQTRSVWLHSPHENATMW